MCHRYFSQREEKNFDADLAMDNDAHNACSTYSILFTASFSERPNLAEKGGKENNYSPVNYVDVLKAS